MWPPTFWPMVNFYWPTDAWGDLPIIPTLDATVYGPNPDAAIYGANPDTTVYGPNPIGPLEADR